MLIANAILFFYYYLDNLIFVHRFSKGFDTDTTHLYHNTYMFPNCVCDASFNINNNINNQCCNVQMRRCYDL